MEPENDGFQKESSFPGVDFQFHVKLPGCISYMDAMGLTTFFTFLNLDNWDMILEPTVVEVRSREDAKMSQIQIMEAKPQNDSKGYGF